MNKLIAAAGLVCLTALMLPAQTIPGKNFIGAKVLFIEYGRANSVDSLNLTNGMEVVYQHNLNPYLSFAIPAKLGVANVIGDLDNRRIASLDALLHVHWYKPTARIWPYLLGGAGLNWEEFEMSSVQVPLGGGINIRVGKDSYINLQGEYRWTKEPNRKNLQAGLGFIYRLGKVEPDRDFDGVKDSADACPDEPGAPELAGCPDRDGDGVADREDRCPDVAGVASLRGCPDSDGDGIADRDDQCPDVAGPADLRGCPDRDGDGVADNYDDCPDEPGIAANKGCPVPDRDGDGVADDMDDCPDERGSKMTRGCPDRDGDGVADSVDRCPDAPGTFAGCPDSDGDGLVDPEDRCPNEAGPATNRGCPEIKEETKEALEFAMRAVQFETGNATLLSESFTVLDQIEAIMKQYPSYRLVISGHTDSVGDAQANLVLSEQRAKACYQYLVSKGVSPGRLSYSGYGETFPIANNNTAEGRKLNRRVQFELFLD